MAQLMGAILGLLLIHWTGKRPLAIISTLGSSLCFFVVSAYVFIKQYDEKLILNVTWIPLVFLNTAAFMTHISIRLLPWMLIGEVIKYALLIFVLLIEYNLLKQTKIFRCILQIFELKQVVPVVLVPTYLRLSQINHTLWLLILLTYLEHFFYMPQ